MIQPNEEGSSFVRHLPCPNCGSSDANSLYSNGTAYCFACGHYTPAEGEEKERPPKKKGGRLASMLDGEVLGLRSRRISQETCARYNYRVGEHKGQTVQIAPYYDENGQLCAQKIRTKDKEFTVRGDIKRALPFGSQAWPKGGKKLILTEGEIDAMAVAQLWGCKFPVWSIACGADNPTNLEGEPLPMNKIRKYIAQHREHFLKFDEVILLFDSDEQGRASAKAAAQVIGSKAKIAEIPLKDAGEMVEQGRTEELIRAIYNAQPYRPEGLVMLDSLEASAKEQPVMGLSWQFPTLTQLTYGIQPGVIYAFGGATGVGKTDFLWQLITHLLQEEGLSLGAFLLEEEPQDTAKGLVSKLTGKMLYLPDHWDEEVFNEGWERINSKGKLHLYDSFGINSWESIKEKIEYLHHSEGVNYFILDHLTAMAAAEEDERKGLERIMSEMGSMVKKLGITIILVSHLSTPEGRPHEEGGRVMIRHFKGSRSIGFWCHGMFGLERNQQAEDEIERRTTVIRILKLRRVGFNVGKCVPTLYDIETGLSHECEPSAEDYGFEEGESGGEEGNDF